MFLPNHNQSAQRPAGSQSQPLIVEITRDLLQNEADAVWEMDARKSGRLSANCARWTENASLLCRNNEAAGHGVKQACCRRTNSSLMENASIAPKQGFRLLIVEIFTFWLWYGIVVPLERAKNIIRTSIF